MNEAQRIEAIQKFREQNHELLQRLMGRDIAQRSISGVFAHFGLSSLVLSLTPILRRAPLAGAIFWVVLNVVGVVRFYLAKNYPEGSRSALVRWFRLFRIGTAVSAFLWGLLAVLALDRFGFDRTTLTVLLCFAGMGTGSVLTLSPDLAASRLFLLALILTPTVALFFLGGGTSPLGSQAPLLAVVLLVFLGFTLAQVRHGHRQYWDSLVNVQLLAARGRELAAATRIAESASRAKDEFLANMSHEIRTPMNAVLGMTEALMDSPLSDEQRQQAGIICTSGRDLMRRLDDMLDFSKSEAGEILIDRQRFPLLPLLEGVLTRFASDAQAKGLELSGIFPRNLPRTVTGDPVRLRQILRGLLENAIKFTDRGEIVLEAETVRVGTESPRIRFVVEDTGIGIPETHLTAIFDAFTQVDGSSTRRHGGVGQGP